MEKAGFKEHGTTFHKGWIRGVNSKTVGGNDGYRGYYKQEEILWVSPLDAFKTLYLSGYKEYEVMLEKGEEWYDSFVSSVTIVDVVYEA